MPLLSIVIANFNFGRFLEDAIKSVLSQGEQEDVELIICDAASSDNSVSVIRKYEDRIAWWCSEPDGGQSEAFNKGFLHAKGKYLTWLNADDIMVAGCLARILHELECHPECEWFTGNHFRVDAWGDVLSVGWGPHIYPMWAQRRCSPLVVFGPSTIFAKSLLERMGGFDERMHLMMDTDLWKRFVVAGVKQRRINCFIWIFRMHEKSKTAEFGGHVLDENKRQQFERERKMSIEKTGYHPSRLLRLFGLAMRVVDGSAFVALFLKLTMRKS